MRQKVRKSVFETNSSTSHTLTLAKWMPETDEELEVGLIPSHTVFEFNHYPYIEELGEGCYEEKHARTQQERLAVCIALCLYLYAHDLGLCYYSPYVQGEVDEDNGVTLNDVLKEKPYFKELYQVIKNISDTELVITGASDLDSLNDDMAFEPLLRDCRSLHYENASYYDLFYTILYDVYEIIDEVVSM